MGCGNSSAKQATQPSPVSTRPETTHAPVPTHPPQQPETNNAQDQPVALITPDEAPPSIAKQASLDNKSFTSTQSRQSKARASKDGVGSKKAKSLTRLQADAQSSAVEVIRERRLNVNSWLSSDAPTDPDVRALRVSAVATNGQMDQLAFLQESESASQMLNDLGVQMLPSTMAFVCTAISISTELLSQIRDGSGSDADFMDNKQAMRILTLKALWQEVLKDGRVRTFAHPRLGVVPVIQPVLHTCIQWRFTGAPRADGAELDPIFDFVLAHGARVDVPNSLGLTALHTLAEAVERIALSGGAELPPALELAKRLVQGGASPKERTQPFSGDVASLSEAAGLESKLGRPEGFDAIEATRLLRKEGAAESLAALERTLERSSELEDCVGELMEEVCRAAGETTAAAAGQGAEAPPCSGSPLEGAPAATPTQAAYHALWLASQLTALPTAAGRRRLLATIAGGRTPFHLPATRVLPAAALKRLGRLPTDHEDGKDEMVDIACVPDNAVVAYVSMFRGWQGEGGSAYTGPFREVEGAVRALEEEVGASKSVFLWVPGCLSRGDGEQLMAVHIACCEEFLYLAGQHHEQNAWCQVERHMQWQLGCQESKLCWQNETLFREPASQGNNPELGHLFSEEDRPKLIMITALFQHA